ncbi:hypothetical protein NDN08_004376 [Rhodosorus marinus]|uniref:Uncharacterized protein n=1 Tax=Rhodosorus marinus TaxID=101924 RepID=A0AAV8UQ18_9RHOD|nr:hypothetical protein NDN08_004376 [Rhodosorus marinus]
MRFRVFRSRLLHGAFARGGCQSSDRSASRLRRTSSTKASDCVFIASESDARAGKKGETLCQNESDLVNPASGSGTEASLIQRASHNLSVDRITGASGEHQEALVKFEQFDDEISRLSHRPLNVFLRPRMEDRVQAYGDLIREGALPGVIQGAGVIMTIAVPIHYMLQDFKDGWMCPKHDHENIETVFCGPVYDMRIHGDSTMSEILYRERAYLSLMIYSPTMQIPTSFRFLRVPVDTEFPQRLPFYHYNEDKCVPLQQGMQLVRRLHGLSVLVPPMVLPPRLLWVDLEHYQIGAQIKAGHAIAPKGSEQVQYLGHSHRTLYSIDPVRLTLQ